MTAPSHTEHAAPDFVRLREISAEAERLRDAGQWTKAAFDKLLAQAKSAANGQSEFIEFLALYAQPSWLK